MLWKRHASAADTTGLVEGSHVMELPLGLFWASAYNEYTARAGWGIHMQRVYSEGWWATPFSSLFFLYSGTQKR